MIHLNTKKIILTTDFSDTSNIAIKHGGMLAKQTGGEIFLIHVMHDRWEIANLFTPGMTVENREKPETVVQQKLEEFAGSIGKNYGVKVTTIMKTGNPTKEILNYAKEIGAGMIVMGTHGYSAWEDLVIGSNALKVLTKSTCPVLTTSERTNKFGYKTIILPIDTSGNSRAKVVLTMELAKQFSAQVFAVGILAGNEGNEKGDMEVMLNQVVTEARNHGVVCTTDLVMNVKNRAVATVNYCNEKNGDLICIMTDQDAELSGFFLGPYALQVIQHAKVPVISIKPEEHPQDAGWEDILAGT